MPKGFKADKPKLNVINPDLLPEQVITLASDYMNISGYDINDPKQRHSVPHNELTRCMKYIYNNLFKPDKKLMNNQNSIIDYDNIDQLNAVIDSFLDLCMWFNKSLGLMSLSAFSGIDYTTLIRWVNNPELNPERSKIIIKAQEYHKALQIGLLNDSPVGALAVANNDMETGLEWSKQQAALQANNTVFILPSERSGRLALTDQEQAKAPVD